MTDENYRRALRDVIEEYQRLARQRAEIDERIAQLLQTMGSLSRLCNLVPTVKLGLTDACRLVLKAAGQPLTVAEVRMQLEAMGFDSARYSNMLASIHVVLKRLCRSGEIKFTPRPHGRPAYAWTRPIRVVAISKSSNPARLDLWPASDTDRLPKGE